MSLARQIPFFAIKSCFIPKSITYSDLETLFPICKNFKHFSQILCQMISTGLIKDTYAASRILRFSTDSSFICIDYSVKIFKDIENPNGFIWNTMLRTFVRKNKAQDSVFLYKSMLNNDILYIDEYTFPILIQGCAIGFLKIEGRGLHNHVVKMGFVGDVYVVNNLINMYSLFGDVAYARKVFDESSILDLVSWNSMLAGYVSSGSVEAANLLYSQMPKKNTIASNSMIVLLGKSGRVSEAHQLFTKMEERDLVSWTALISCYEQNGVYIQALSLFVNMCNNRVSADEVVFVSVLSACAQLSSPGMGKSVHGMAIRTGFESYVNLQNV